MSCIKNKFFDQIFIAGSLDNRSLDDLFGVSFTAEGKTVVIDDFIESADGLMVCVLVYDGGRETYVILDEPDFRKIVFQAENVTYPETA